jgi:hypothetical protein
VYKKRLLMAVVAGTTAATQAATLNVAVDAYVPYDQTTPENTTSEIRGTLRVTAGAVFTPVSLDIIGGSGVNGISNPDAPSGELNGDVYFDGGSISVGSINVGLAGRLFVNEASAATSVQADGPVVINANFSVTGSPATYVASGLTTVSAGATLSTGTISFGTSFAQLAGEGTVSAISFALGEGVVSPGAGEFDTGTLTLASSAVDLNDVMLVADVSLGGTDVLAIDGTASGLLQVLPIGFETLTEADVLNHGPFVFLTADEMAADFLILGGNEIYNDLDEVIGYMVIETTPTSAYFTYEPVPEPAAVGAVAIGLLMGRRRRG